MPWRRTTLACILALSCTVLFFSFTYGPLCRVYATPTQAVVVANEAEIYPLLKKAGLKGRVLLLLSPDLSLQIGMNTSNESIELAMRHGLVRTAYQIVPDSSWPQVFAANLQRSMPTPPKISESDFTLLLEAGRITVMPLSRFWPLTETVIIVIDPAAWTPDERSYILRLLQSGSLTADFIIMINGSPADLQNFGASLYAH